MSQKQNDGQIERERERAKERERERERERECVRVCVCVCLRTGCLTEGGLLHVATVQCDPPRGHSAM